jgi:hypothetical protein
MQYYSKSKSYDRFVESANKFSAGILILAQTCTDSIAIIDDQYAIIESEIAATSLRHWRWRWGSR